MVSEGGVGSIRIWLVSAVSVRAFFFPMVVWAGGSDPVCIAVPGLWSLVTDVATSMDALATYTDIFAASAPAVSDLAAAAAAVGWGSPLAGRVDILNGDCKE